MCKRAIPLRLGFFHGSAWYICVCRVYVHVCVHACLCETEDNLKCLSQASSTFVFVCGHTYVCTSVCAHVCRCMCRCICVHVETRGQLLVSPQSPFTLFFLFFFVGFVLFLRQWSHHVALASHTMPSTRSREGGDKNPCPLR